MKTWTLTLCYMNPAVIDSSLRAYYSTADRVGEHILIDHLWPVSPKSSAQALLSQALDYEIKIMRPYKNMGSFGGLNWCLANIPVQPEDLIITYDCDSNPVTPHWDTLLTDAMADQSYAYVSLGLDMPGINTKDWVYDTTNGGIAVKRPAHGGPEMINVTCWRYKFLKACGGFKGLPYYGGVEMPFFSSAQNLGLKTGYLVDATERLQETPRDERYQEWKKAHVAGTFPRNFDEWI